MIINPYRYGGVGGTLADGLESWWSLDETSGTRVDSVIATGNDLTDNGTVLSAVGKQSNAAQFVNGNVEYLSITGNASLQTGDIDFTHCLWVYLDSVSSEMFLMSGWGPNSSTANLAYTIGHYPPTDTFYYVVGNQSTFGIKFSDSAASVVADTWYFVATWHDSVANTINLQVDNGTIDSLSYSSGSHTNITDFNIGSAGSSLWTDGRIDEVGYWKRLLTASERTELYNSGSGIGYPG